MFIKSLKIYLHNYMCVFLIQVPMKQHKDCNFSYAGLKTQVKLAIESKNMYAIHLISNLHKKI